MAEWEQLCRNPLTGRTVWALRWVPSGVPLGEVEWSLVVIRSHWLSRRAIIMLATGMTVAKRRRIQIALVDKGFASAQAFEHGRWVTWKADGVRKRGSSDR
jgi:hypothetical protein